MYVCTSLPTLSCHWLFVKFEVGSVEVIASRLPKRRRCMNVTSISMSSSVASHSGPPSSDSPPHSDALMHALLPPPPPLPPFMPWKPTDKSGKPAMSQHSPQSVSILHVTTAIFHTFLATTDGAFAPEDEMTREIKASFLMACNEVEAPR